MPEPSPLEKPCYLRRSQAAGLAGFLRICRHRQRSANLL